MPSARALVRTSASDSPSSAPVRSGFAAPERDRGTPHEANLGLEDSTASPGLLPPFDFRKIAIGRPDGDDRGAEDRAWERDRADRAQRARAYLSTRGKAGGEATSQEALFLPLQARLTIGAVNDPLEA